MVPLLIPVQAAAVVFVVVASVPETVITMGIAFVHIVLASPVSYTHLVPITYLKGKVVLPLLPKLR